MNRFGVAVLAAAAAGRTEVYRLWSEDLCVAEVNE